MEGPCALYDDPSMPLRTVISLLLLVLPQLGIAQSCEPPTLVLEAPPEQVHGVLADQGKRVLTFLGYSGAEYQDKAAMLEVAVRVLEQFDSATTVVNVGATAVGIGAVYELAKRRGFTTSGIVSTQAREHQAALSPCVDLVFYVPDDTWGGLLPNTDVLSPTSAAIVQSSDVVVAIGGGEVARDELIAASLAGKQVRYVPADMNHQIARERARKKGQPRPTDFRGAAADVNREPAGLILYFFVLINGLLQ